MESSTLRTRAPTTMWDVLRAGLVVAFAFLATSFPARNADIWLRLATGRALIHGDYHFGTDPFSYTTADSYWVNHGWLFDAASYGLLAGSGGTALVIVKALLIALLAVWLLRPCWAGPHRWLAFLLVAIAVTAIGPYTLLRPICVSLLFLGITYVWLELRASSVGWRQAIPILLLFVVWANVDEWFLLGPGLAALWALATLVTPARPAAAARRAGGFSVIAIAVAGFALANANPHHIRVFTLPALLDPSTTEETFDDAGDRATLHSPLEDLDDADAWQRTVRIANGRTK